MKNEASQKSTLMMDVTLFDSFQITYGDKVIDSHDIKSEMVTKLFVYMVCHLHTDVSAQDLSEALWGEEGCDNPVGALKNLVYRLRSTLKTNIGDYQFMITGHGTYRWNDDIVLNVDAQRFENICKVYECEDDIKKRIQMGVEADSIYKEKFLPQYMDEYWVMSLSVYYHSLYLNMIKQLAQDFEEEKRFYEMEEVCRNAISIDGLDEDLHYFLIKALVYENKQNMALDHYKSTSDLLYDSLGVRPSDRLRGVYEEILKSQHSFQMDITKIKEELSSEQTTRKGAFMCEYGVFKKNYDLEIRRAKRLGVSVFLGLVTITPVLALQIDSQAYKNVINLGVKQTQNVLMESLRSGDVISRYSSRQFIVMLPACNYEDAKMVMGRVLHKFEVMEHKARIKIDYSLDEMN